MNKKAVFLTYSKIMPNLLQGLGILENILLQTYHLLGERQLTSNLTQWWVSYPTALGFSFSISEMEIASQKILVRVKWDDECKKPVLNK